MNIRELKLLHNIYDGENFRMPCGDMRVAIILTRRGFLTQTNLQRNSHTTDYEITASGLMAITP